MAPPSDEALFCLVGADLPLRTSGRRVKLGFTDAAGVRWLRDQYGRLTELQSNMRIKVDSSRAAVLSQFQEDFLATYGVTVEFDASDYPQDAFLADLQTSSAADALVCPHDWIGDLIARDVVEPTILSADHREAFPEWALAALSVGSSLYGLPMTVDTVALIRNTELAPRQPATFDELIAMGTALRDTGRVDEAFVVRVGERGDPFQIWPLFHSAGGWLFGRAANGEWDSTQIGLATPESIAALNRLRALGEVGTGMLRRSMDRTEVIELFASGRSPFLLTTSDAMPRIREAGVLVHVTAVPPFTWVLGNHDVTRIVSRLGMDQTLIRNPTDALRRGAVEVDVSLGTHRARAAALLLFALPGSAYLYQGDELGLPSTWPSLPIGGRTRLFTAQVERP